MEAGTPRRATVHIFLIKNGRFCFQIQGGSEQKKPMIIENRR
jgi:hypothetical protein